MMVPTYRFREMPREDREHKTQSVEPEWIEQRDGELHCHHVQSPDHSGGQQIEIGGEDRLLFFCHR